MNDSINWKLCEIRQLAERLLTIAGDTFTANANGQGASSESAFVFKGGQVVERTRARNPAEQLEAELPRLIATAKALYSLRQRRDPIFGFEACKEPHWDMLLDLFINRATGRRVSITSACIASNRPVTTSLRWIDYLEESGVLQKVACEFDQRKTYVELTVPTYVKMLEYLHEVGRTFRNLGAPSVLPQFPALQG